MKPLLNLNIPKHLNCVATPPRKKIFFFRKSPQSAVDELVGLLSQEDQSQTHCSTRHVSKETGLTQSSVVWVVHCNFGLK